MNAKKKDPDKKVARKNSANEEPSPRKIAPKEPEKKNAEKGMGIGKVISVSPDAKLKIIKSSKTHTAGEIVNFKAKFTPAIGKTYFFKDTRAESVVVLTGSGGRGTIISAPPPGTAGTLQVTASSDMHAAGDRPTYFSTRRQTVGAISGFIDRPDGTVWI